MHYLEIGGAETSLIGLLQTLDPERVEVDLFLNEHRGEMMAYIPDWVNVLPERKAYAMIECPIGKVLRAGYFHIAAARLFAKLHFKFYAAKNHLVDLSAQHGFVNKYLMSVLPSLKNLGEYDLAIAFLPPYGIVLDKVKARKKVCWIHTDYTQIEIDHKMELSVWRRYDNIVSISKETTRTFCEIFPELKEKMVDMENILPRKFIDSRAVSGPYPADMEKAEGELVLLTIGRFCHAKKMEEIPAICRGLRERGLSVRWYLIGYGGGMQQIIRAIAEAHMEEHVILLGKRENPYPYLKACDWYVQPSRYEGKSVVVREAQMLGKPVIITNYPTAASQVVNGVDGIIVPMPLDACIEAMAQTLADHELRARIMDYVASHDYGNECEVEKIYNMIPH